MTKKKSTKTIAPRLASGVPRVQFGHGLPDAIKEGLRAIARGERKSMSWLVEEVFIDYFGLRRPRYKKPTVATGDVPRSGKRRTR